MSKRIVGQAAAHLRQCLKGLCMWFFWGRLRRGMLALGTTAGFRVKTEGRDLLSFQPLFYFLVSTSGLLRNLACQEILTILTAQKSCYFSIALALLVLHPSCVLDNRWLLEYPALWLGGSNQTLTMMDSFDSMIFGVAWSVIPSLPHNTVKKIFN